MSGPSDSILTSDVVFADATAQQRTLSWELNGASWAPPMTLAEYLGREETLRNVALSANGGTKYYVLHLRSDPNTIVSGCEVISKTVLIADGGQVKEAKAYSIASVFTAPRFRGQGMAGWMLKQVQQAVDETTECGVLYSDIGRAYYTGLGWKDYPSPQLTFKLEGGFEAPGSPGVVLLQEEDVEPLCEKDIKVLREKSEKSAADGKRHLTFLPSFTQMAWHFARDRYVAKIMIGRDVVNRGARMEDGKSWLYWDHDLREKKIKILRIVTDSEDDWEKRKGDVKALLQAALEEARDWNLPKVLIWGPGSEASVAATELWKEAGGKLQVVFDERQDGSIPSLRWKRGEDVSGVVWEENEYFAWC